MVIRLYSAGLEGVDAFPVEVEVDLVRQGLPGFTLVGLAEAAVREARERVFSALRACGFRLPPSRITVNLAPAGRRKSGTAFDLPLALGLLAASGQIPVEALQGRIFAGELSLSGALKPVPGMLPLAIMARQQGLTSVILPPDNGAEAAVVRGVAVRTPAHLSQCVAFLLGREALEARQPLPAPAEDAALSGMDFAEVRGQQGARRALEVASDAGFELTRREAVTLTRTFIQTANVNAQEAVYKANEGLFKGYRYVATLDNRTCAVCLFADGAVYKIGEPRPSLPRHPRCRCLYVPIAKSWRDFGIDVDDLEAVVRPWTIRETGPIGTGGRKIENYGKTTENFSGWWASLSDTDKAKTAIGPVRRRLLETGAVKWDQMWDKASGLPLTLEQMGYDRQGNRL